MKCIKIFKKEKKGSKSKKNFEKSKLNSINDNSKLQDEKETSKPIESIENLKVNDTLNVNETNKNEKKTVEIKNNTTATVETKNNTTEQVETKNETSESTETPVEDRIEKKKILFKSLWEKEYEYADVLVRMLQSFRKPLIEDVKSGNPTISMDQIETLFDGYDEILNLSWNLCGELKIIYNMYKQLKSVNLGDVFLKHVKEFDVYFKYCSRFVTANELLRDLNTNMKFRRYQNALLESTTLLKDDDYREVLRLPIYHIAEYDKILKELLENTAKYDPSYEMLEDSYEYIDELYLEMKEALKKEKKMDEILEIKKSIVNCPRSVVKPGRYLYRDFNNLIELPSHTPYRIVIFSDILLLAKWDRKMRKFVYHRVIYYKGLKVVDSVSKADPTLFSLLLLNPFTKKNFDIAPQNGRGRGRGQFAIGNNRTPPIRQMNNINNRNDSFSHALSRLFSWSFNQNITRIDLKAADVETQNQIVTLINKRISELHPPPFELLWPDPKDIYDVDIIKGIRNPVPANPDDIILDSYICNAIYHSFPKRLRIKRSLTLLYSLQNHGSSLNTFYERSNAGYGTAQVLAIKDDNDNIFGCFTAEPFKINNGFYGTGESFLFKVQKPKTLGRRKNFGIGRTRSKDSGMSDSGEAQHGEVKVFPWAKTNYLFINSNSEYVAVGSGQGKYGIWCDSQFQTGQSYPTETYHNECLAGTERFNIVNVELWTFTSQIEREFLKKRKSRFPTKFQKRS
ncbi:TLD-domain-containing protein [Neocallimastix sp. 'constans']|jgi:hypothetical protein